MNSEVSAALIQGAATLLAAAAGFGAIFYQMGRQSGLARQALKDEEARRLKNAMYEDGTRAARDLADSAIDFGTALHSARGDFFVLQEAAKHGVVAPLPRARYPALTAQFSDLSEVVFRFVFLIENRRIIDPRLIIFRDVALAHHHDLMTLVHGPFVTELMRALPTELPDGTLHPYTAPGPEQIGRLRELLLVASAKANDLTSLVEDFVVEMQNLMLGDVFGTTVEHRQPLDPNERVIKLEDFEALREWVAATGWGKRNQAAEEEYQESIASPS